MKQITMDYETYEKEIKEAKLEGFEKQKDLLKKLKSVAKGLQDRDMDGFNLGMYDLQKLIKELS